MAGEDAAKSGNHNARLFRISLNLAKGSLNAYRFALLDDLRTILKLGRTPSVTLLVREDPSIVVSVNFGS